MKQTKKIRSAKFTLLQNELYSLLQKLSTIHHLLVDLDHQDSEMAKTIELTLQNIRSFNTKLLHEADAILAEPSQHSDRLQTILDTKDVE